MIYLDNAATTLPKPDEVVSAVQRAMGVTGSLGRGNHEAAQYASEIAFSCREQAGASFDINPENVVFTLNATHGLNIAIKSIVAEGDRVVVSGFEHNAVMRPLYGLNAKIETAGRCVFDPENTLREFEQKIDGETKAVVCTHVSNVYGYILPILEIANLCRSRGVPLIIDASQSAGILSVSMKETGAAFIAMPGHKGLMGPQGTGLLLCSKSAMPIIEGGTGSNSKSMQMPDYLPDRLEAGTMNMHGIAGLLEGLRYISRRRRTLIEKHEKELIRRLIDGLDKKKYVIFCADENRQSGVLSIIPKDKRCEDFSERCARSGFAVRSGLHCAPIAHRSGGSYDTGTVRISVSALTKMSDIDEFICFANQLKFL